jgi:hypothetical protein
MGSLPESWTTTAAENLLSNVPEGWPTTAAKTLVNPTGTVVNNLSNQADREGWMVLGVIGNALIGGGLLLIRRVSQYSQ